MADEVLSGIEIQDLYPYWAGSEDEARAWDTCKIDGILIENVTVEVVKERDIDVKKSPGADGATFSDKGYEPAKVTIKVKITSRDEWNYWCGTVLPRIDPQKLGGLTRPMEFISPEANSKNISVIYIRKITGDTPTASKGKTETIEAVHWVPKPKPAKSNMTAPKKPVQTPAGPPPAQLFNNLADKMEADAVGPNLPKNTFFDYTGGNGSS